MGKSAAVIVRVRPAPGDAPVLPSKAFQSEFLSGYLGPDASQLQARAMLDPLVEKFTKQMESVVIFAYGQTGSGKTHSVLGPPGSLTEHAVSNWSGGSAPADWGMFPAIALETFATMSPQSVLKCSVVEVYLDRVYDLLNSREQISVAGVGTKAIARGVVNCNTNTRDENGKWVNPFLARELQQKRDKEHRSTAAMQEGMEVASNTITSPQDVARISRLIEATRTAQSHNLNDRSSRSHCIITLRLESVNPATKRLEQCSFTFADLAGSERVKSSGVDADDHGRAKSFNLKGNVSIDIPGSRFDEAKNVNASLASLSRLMVAMSTSTKGHLPWRDSTLNLVLKESFTSSAASKSNSSPNIVLLMAVREDASAEKETISTYRFGKVVASSKGASGSRTQSTTRGRGGSIAVPSATRSKSLGPQPHVSSSSTTTTGGGETLEDRIDRLTAERDALVAGLDSMKDDPNEAGGANPEKGANVQRDFLYNKKVLDDSKDHVRSLKEQAKAKAKSRGASVQDDPKVLSLQKDLQANNEQIHIFQGLVARMIVSGCYLPPSKKYTSMQKRLATVNQELAAFSQVR